jgi:cis-3-alkyl-4-acyloxetan-2-one decarboxylase
VVTNLYPFNGRFLDRGGIRLHYLDEGDGPAVVMLHGNPSWSFYYRNLVLALRRRHRCVVPDHIGCGLSDKPSTEQYDYSLKSRIADLDALLERLGVKECSLIVHDWGGMIGMAWAVRNVQRVRRLVILNTAAFHIPKSKRLPLALWFGRNSWLGTWLIRGLNLFCRRAASIGVQRKPMAADVRAEYLRPYDSWQNRIAISKFVQTIPLKPGDPGYEIVTEVEQGLPNLQAVPMLIAWGLRDFVFDHHFLAEWEQRFPDAEVMRFEDCGHYILEDAAKEVIPRICNFLEEQ